MNHFIPLKLLYMIYDLLIVFSSFFMTRPWEMVALTTSRIYLNIYSIDITNIDKICDYVGQKLSGCEAQEGAE